MSELTPRDRELVALGAAMGSNCVPCVEYHIPESRKAGLADAEIHAAILHADKIRQVPARKTLQAALKLLPFTAPTEPAKVETNQTAQPHDVMKGMMSKMMATCGNNDQTANAPNAAAAKPATTPATSEGCCS